MSYGESSPVRVVVVSDDRLFADGVVKLFESRSSFDVECRNLVGRCGSEDADVILLDSRAEGALARCTVLTKESEVPVIFVAAPDDDVWATDAISMGARGVLGLDACAEDLRCSIRTVMDGVIWAPRRVLSLIVERLLSESDASSVNCQLPEERLSDREREVLHHAAQGLCNKELAQCLEISEATVKVHLTHIFRKLGLRGRAELAAAYFGFATPSRYV